MGSAMRIVALALVGLLPAAAASGATFTVNSTLDAIDTAPGNGVCAIAGGACTLRAAVQEANALAGADVITLPAGVFRLTRVGATEDAAATGDLDVSQALEIDGAGSGETIVDGLGADRVFHVTVSSAVTLTGLTIRNGDPGAGPGGGILDVGPAALVLRDVEIIDCRADVGGGIYQGGSLTLEDCTLEDDRSGSAGGGVFASPGAALAISRSHFRTCLATSTGGAVFYSGGGAAPIGITDSTFEGNFSNTAGGACFVTGGGDLTVTGSQFTDNRATSTGGALFHTGTAGLTITGSTFVGNASLTSVGGGIFGTSSGPTTLTDVEVRDNSSLANGGGLFTSGAATSTVTSCRFVDNVAAGPGAGVFDATIGNVSITDSTFSGNRAFGTLGGGLFIAAGGALALRSSTFADNHATGPGGLGAAVFLTTGAPSSMINATFSENLAGGMGGAVYAASPLTLTNATLARNGAGTTGGDLFNGSTISLTSTILTEAVVGGGCAGVAVTSGGGNIDNDGCALAGPGDRSGIDPLLGPLQDNGGPTETLALLPGSPAIDTGNAGACPGIDQRGSGRPTDGDKDGSAACDVGAFELVDLCPADPVKFVPGVCGCGVADTDANANGVDDCLVNAELKARIARVRTLLDGLTGKRDAAQKGVKAELRDLTGGIADYVKEQQAAIVLADPKAKLPKLARRLKGKARRAARARHRALTRARRAAESAADALDAAVAPQ
jgi:large repetitive protein